MENLPQTIGTKEVEARVIELRGQKIILDRDVAELYQTETREINKAVKSNPEKFLDGYCFTLQPSEKQYVVENFHRMESLKKSTVEPRAFTERGLYMLETILKSKRATQTTIAIIDSFAKLRELTRNIEAIHNESDNAKQKGLSSAQENFYPTCLWMIQTQLRQNPPSNSTLWLLNSNTRSSGQRRTNQTNDQYIIGIFGIFLAYSKYYKHTIIKHLSNDR